MISAIILIANKHYKYIQFIFFLLLCCNIFFSCNTSKSLTYPITEEKIVIDKYFGIEVEDPYQWMENDKSQKLTRWIKMQNNLTYSYLEKIPYRQAIKERLEELWNYEKISTPFKEGKYTYFYKNDGLQNQSILYRREG